MKKVLWLMLLISCIVNGQTGIGTAEISTNAALQISSATNDKGIILPRVTTEERDQMAIAEGERENGLMIFNTDEQVIQYWSGQAGEWKTFIGKRERATFTLALDKCSEIKVSGDYLEGEGLTDEHYVSLTVNVTTPGMYSIKASSTLDNGYFYYTEGEFLVPGEYDIVVPAQGVPLKATENGRPDSFAFSLNDTVLSTSQAGSCGFTVVVEDTKIYQNFAMLCNTVEVKGVYRANKPMEDTQYITVELKAEQNAIGAFYHLQTNVVDGVKFEAKGRIQSTTQEVVLEPTGVFTTTKTKEFMIMSNSSSSGEICHAKVRVVIPKKRVLALGNSGYGYNIARTPKFGVGANLANEDAFGTKENSVVFSEGFEIDDGGPGKSFFDNEKWMDSALDGDNPYDIIVFPFNVFEFSSAPDRLAKYLRNGGVIIAFMSNEKEAMKVLMKDLMGNDNITAHKSVSKEGKVFKFSYLDDPVLDGPFGDVRGKHWGKEVGMSVGANPITTLFGLDTSRLVVYSDAYDYDSGSIEDDAIGGITGFRHKDYNFIWIGDPGFYSSNNIKNSLTSTKSYPGGGYTETYMPIVKQYGVTKKTDIYNSIFMANLFAWAIEIAENEGINANRGN